MSARLTYKSLRRLVFSVYVLLSVVFCLSLVEFGRAEVRRARGHADNERAYVEGLLHLRAALNKVRTDFNDILLAGPSASSLAVLDSGFSSLDEAFSRVRALGLGRSGQMRASLAELSGQSRLSKSLASALRDDLSSNPSERAELLRQDMDAVSKCLSKSEASVQNLLRHELDHVEVWQRQSLYFFNRLQFVLVAFFVGTTIFSVGASMLFSRALRRSLALLAEGAGQISSGNLGFRFADIPGDEIGALMLEFNLMAEKVGGQADELRRMNASLSEKAELLLRERQLRDRFMANMSHELRTPLNSIIGFSDLILQHASMSADKRLGERANRILAAAEHLLELISELLQVARLDAGVLAPSPSEFDLADCASEVVSMLAPLAEGKGLALSLAPDSPPAVVFADRKMIRQALVNIVGNAVKFTLAGRVDVSVRASGSDAVVVVADTGVGISEEDQKNIFSDFFRAESGLTNNFEGAGIGLTLSKRLVEKNLGRIILNSELGKGSAFSVVLPLKNNKEI